jgi:hypothetical protein
MSKLVSYKVVDRDGDAAFVIIIKKDVSLVELNELLRKGMSVTAIDVRSELVNKAHVD